MLSRRMLKSKLHRLTVTDANLDYEGSITLPPKLMELSDIVQWEAVSVWNVTRGTRFETYVIEGAQGSTDVIINGAAAHLAGPGDIIIVAAFSEIPEENIGTHQPRAIYVDSSNNPKQPS